MGSLAIICSIFGFQKMADKFDVTIKNSAVDSERNIASNGELKSRSGVIEEKNKQNVC